MDYNIRHDCRLCSHEKFSHVINLGPTPIANELFSDSYTSLNQEKFPLYLVQCNKCGHVQLPVAINPERLFRNYMYVSGTSHVFVKHFISYAETLASKFRIGYGSTVIDIGSNDGTFLKCLHDIGASVIGVDPAYDIAKKATRDGLMTLPEFFSSRLATMMLENSGKVSAITANNVFAHINDLHDFVTGVKILLKPDGMFIFEVSYLVDVLKNMLFDTIYHEHLSYHTVSPLIPFFESQGMRLFDVDFIDTHGGSIRCYVDFGTRPVTKNVEIAKTLELELDFQKFAIRIANLKEQLLAWINKVRASDKIIIGYGAPAKATTLVNRFDLTHDQISCIVEDNQIKQGKYLPGTTIPIISPVGISSYNPDYMLILAWNFAESIIEKNKSFSGKFIIPIPEFKEC